MLSSGGFNRESNHWFGKPKICYHRYFITSNLLTIQTSNFFKQTFAVDLYHPSLTLFIILAIYFSSLSLKKQSFFQSFIIGIRVVVLILIIYGSCYYTKRMNLENFNKVDMNFKNIVQLASNSVTILSQIYAFLLHHSLPVLCRQIDNQKLRKVFTYGYIFVGLSMVLIIFLAILAFGHLKNSCHVSFPCKISVLYNENFLDLSIIGNIINFYLVLSIAAFPVQVQAILNSICNAFDIKDDLHKILVKIFIFFVIIFTSSCFKNKLTLILEILGGVNGIIIVGIFPSLFILRAQKIAQKKLDDYKPKYTRLPYLIILVASIQIILTIYIKFFN